MLVEYVRKGGIKKVTKVKKMRVGGRRVGVLVAVPYKDDKVRIGWSLCNHSAGDKFNKQFGYNIAVNRAITGSKTPIAKSLIGQAEKFVKRVSSYYKDKEVDVTFELHNQPKLRKEVEQEVGC